MAYRGIPKNPKWLNPDRDLNTLSPNARRAYRYWSKIQEATPPWYDPEAAAEFYRKAERRGLVVDHIVPLRSNIVCGLNWHGNYQLLTAEENGVKSNHWWPDCPHECLTLDLPEFLFDKQMKLKFY